MNLHILKKMEKSHQELQDQIEEILLQHSYLSKKFDQPIFNINNPNNPYYNSVMDTLIKAGNESHIVMETSTEVSNYFICEREYRKNLDNLNYTRIYHPSYLDIKKEQTLLMSNYNTLVKEQNQIFSEIQKIKLIILKESYMPQYIRYAQENNIKYNKYNEESIFWECNKHHMMLNCLERKNDIDSGNCNEQIEELHVIGSNIVVGTCKCQHYIWYSKNPPEDLYEFNLDSKHVYGSIQTR